MNPIKKSLLIGTGWGLIVFLFVAFIPNGGDGGILAFFIPIYTTPVITTIAYSINILIYKKWMLTHVILSIIILLALIILTSITTPDNWYYFKELFTIIRFIIG